MRRRRGIVLQRERLCATRASTAVCLHSDLVFKLSRDGYYGPLGGGRSGNEDVLLSKQRSGGNEVEERVQGGRSMAKMRKSTTAEQ